MSTSPEILIAADHAGIELKQQIQEQLSDFNFVDLGPGNTDSVDYPDYAEGLSHRISKGMFERGILICGSGIGMCIAANKIKGIRAALVTSEEMARLSRAHNNANVLCLGAKITPIDEAIKIVRKWLTTEFSNEPRHHRRNEKVMALEGK